MNRNTMFCSLCVLSLAFMPSAQISGQQQDGREIVSFTLKDFKETITTMPCDTLSVLPPDTRHLSRLVLLGDSLLFCQYIFRKPPLDYGMEILHLKTGERILSSETKEGASLKRIAGRGVRVKKWLGESYLIVNNYTSDHRRQNAFTEINLDRLIKEKERYTPRKLNRPNESEGGLSLIKTDQTHYMVQHAGFLDDAKFNNGVERFIFFDQNLPPEENKYIKYPYRVDAVNQFPCFLSEKDRDIVWCLDGHRDKIDIYNIQSGKTVKTLMGPYHYQGEYLYNEKAEQITWNNVNSHAYTSGYVTTENGVYLLFRHQPKLDIMDQDNYQCEIFYFDWDGRPLKRFLLHKPIVAFDVDQTGKYFYCLETVRGMNQLIRYKFE